MKKETLFVALALVLLFIAACTANEPQENTETATNSGTDDTEAGTPGVTGDSNTATTYEGSPAADETADSGEEAII